MRPQNWTLLKSIETHLDEKQEGAMNLEVELDRQAAIDEYLEAAQQSEAEVPHINNCQKFVYS